MNRERVRLLLRDLGVGAAFLSMALSGQVPTWAMGVFAVALTLAILNLRVFAQRSRVSVGVLLLAAVVLYASVAAGRLDLVVAACTFAGLLAGQRLLSAPSDATDHQVHLTSLLMVAGGAALSGDLLFAPCLVVFTILASLSLGMSVVAGSGKEAAQVPLRPLLRVLGVGVFLALLGGAALFVLFPRLSWSLAGRRPSRGLGVPTTGFSDQVQIDGAGRLKTSPRVVLRARLTPDPGGDSLHEYWPGHVFTTFDGRGWTGAVPPRAAKLEVTPGPSAKKLTLQQVELLPGYASHTVVGMDVPVMFGNAVAHQPNRDVRTRLIELPAQEVRLEQEAPAYAYQVYSRLSATTAVTWTQAQKERALALPDRLDPRVAALARTIVGAERDPLRQAHALERYLTSNYSYTLELPGAVADPLVDFLFLRKAGHCEHFATALTVMLRTLGVPAQVVAGFFGGERRGGEYLLRAGDAHAWVQAYVEGTGVVRLDATPPSGREARPNVVLDWILQEYEALESRWERSVVDYSFRDQAELVEKAMGERGASKPSTPWTTARQRQVALALLGLAALGWGAYRLRGAWKKDATLEATRLCDEAERLLVGASDLRSARAKNEDAAPEPLEVISRRLLRSAHPLAPAVETVTRRYLEARFGQKPLGPGERRRLRGELTRALGQTSRRE